MKSIRASRIVVVTDSDQGRILATRLRRMDIAKVTAVIGLEEARRLCQSGGADACLVAIDTPVPDGVPVTESDAPGRCCGVPALIVAAVVTPHLRETARRCGYLAAVSTAIPPRMLYRRLGAALQRRRSARVSSRRFPLEMPLAGRSDPAVFGKPTLH
jgi:DNA-binding response OmpR family regulator